MRRVDYLIVYVADLDRSVRFYRDLLGLELRFQEPGYAEFATEGTRLGLFPRAQVPDLLGHPAGAGPVAEVAFLVDDVDAEAARLRAAGATVLAGPVDRPWRQRTLHLADPDGFVVELAQDLPR